MFQWERRGLEEEEEEEEEDSGFHGKYKRLKLGGGFAYDRSLV
jgi:hypothetical protein